MSSSSLNIQSERQARYDRMCHKKLVNQQKVDRTMRVVRRSELMETISHDVSRELSTLHTEKNGMVTRNNCVNRNNSKYTFV